MEEPAQHPEHRKRPASFGSWQESLRDVGPYLGLGTQMVFTMVLFVGGGYLLDQRLGTTPWLLLTSTLVGMGAVFVLLFRVVRHLNKDAQSRRPPRPDDDEPAAPS